MLTKFHEFRATSLKMTKGTIVRYPITFDTMLLPGGEKVRCKFTKAVLYKAATIKAILHNRLGCHIQDASFKQVDQATLDHINSQIHKQ